MASSCSHWWHAPIYITISIILAMVAISTSFHSINKAHIPISPKQEPSYIEYVSVNASHALRKSGFNFMATLLQISTHLLPPFESTIFAIQDPAISNISLPSWKMKDLMHYHTSPIKLSLNDLLQKPSGSCVPTLLHGKNLVITKANGTEPSLQINGRVISHPNIFVDGPYAIHGVLEPFYSFEYKDLAIDEDHIPLPVCNANLGLIEDARVARSAVPWSRILRLLSSNGFISFSIGLHSVLDGILQDLPDLSSVTIFAPPDDGFAYVASPTPLLEMIVRFHILPHRFSYGDLTLMPENAALHTLISDRNLNITSGGNFSEILSINSIQITEPDMFSDQGFIIHGISRAFQMVTLSMKVT